MKKNEILIESYKNIQNLINFMDQKAGFILLICTIVITIFSDYVKNLIFIKENIRLLNYIIFFLILANIFIFISIIYKILMKILFPRVTPSKEYDGSLFYYKYIVENDLKEIEKTFGKGNSTKSILISDLKSVSVILNEKIKYISQTLVLMALNILFTIITVLLIKAL